MNNTKIEWCDSSWNPVTGCFNDCTYCYARKMAVRFGGNQKCANIFEENEPVKSQTGKILPYPHSFSPTFHRYKLDELHKWAKPRTIFVCSMADLFGDWIPDEWICEVFAACKYAPQHSYLFLTKNPKRYEKLYLRNRLPLDGNMWYGTSVTNTEQLEQAIMAFGAAYESQYLFQHRAAVGGYNGLPRCENGQYFFRLFRLDNYRRGDWNPKRKGYSPKGVDRQYMFVRQSPHIYERQSDTHCRGEKYAERISVELLEVMST